MTAQETIEKLKQQFGEDAVRGPIVFRGEFSVEIDPASVVPMCRFLKDQCGYDMLTDLSAVDHYGEEPRFEVEYLVYSLTHRNRVRLKTRIPESLPEVDTVSNVWKTADWHEREAFDLFGICFLGHPNLKRIIMWEGYPHHPLRKDFPLAGLPVDLPASADGAGRVESAPMAGGPFVTTPGVGGTASREPRQADTAAERIVKIERKEPA